MDFKSDKKLLEEFVQNRLKGCETGNRETGQEAVAAVQMKDAKGLG